MAAAGAGAQAPIIVTASRTGAGPAAGVTTVTQEDIARLQPHSLLESLDDVAGVRAFSTGGAGGGSFVSIRGGEPNFTLVLLDGIRVNNPTNAKGGAFDFAQIDPLLVERIEVSRGAGSAVHGSDALSGVIHIRLRDSMPGGAGFTARLQGDSEGGIGGGLAASPVWRGGGALFAASGYDSGKGDGSDVRRGQALARIAQRIGGYDARLIGLYAHVERSGFPEDSGGPRLAVNRAKETGDADLWTAGLSLRRDPSARLRPNLSLSWSEQRDHTDSPAIAPGVLDGVPALAARNRFARFEAIGDLTLERGIVTATIGAGLLREDGRSRGTIDLGFPLPVAFDLDRTTASGFAETSLRPGAGITLNLAGRHDAVRHGAGEWTGRGAIAWQVAPGGPALFAGLGEGFKLPSFYALGHPLVGKPALRPERSRNREAGIEWTSDGGDRLRIAWFDNRFRDLIDFDPELFTTVNRARVRARGVEAEARWRIRSAVTLSGALTHVSLRTATPLRGRPAWSGSARAAWNALRDLELNGAIRFNGPFNDSSIPTGPIRAAGHVEADIGLRHRLARALDLTVTVRNLGNRHYHDAVGWPDRGREIRATIGAAF